MGIWSHSSLFFLAKSKMLGFISTFVTLSLKELYLPDSAFLSSYLSSVPIHPLDTFTSSVTPGELLCSGGMKNCCQPGSAPVGWSWPTFPGPSRSSH